MEENNRKRDGQDAPKRTKARSIKRSASSNGQKSPPCANTATDIWDNCTSIRSARGDEIMDVDVQKCPEMGPETRKRKLIAHENPVLEKKLKRGSIFSSPSKCSEFCDDISACVEVHEQGMASPRALLVFSATTGTGKPVKSDVGCQTSRTPLVPVTPVVSFSEPMRKPPTYVQNGYFGPGALLPDGTLRRPPDDFGPEPVVPKNNPIGPEPVVPKKNPIVPEPIVSKKDPSKSEEEPEVKDWLLKEKEPNPQTKKDFTKDENLNDRKKKQNVNNTERYLNMF